MTFLNMTEAAAGKIGSNYALGSIFAVLLNVVLVKWVKPVRMIVVYPALSLATLLSVSYTHLTLPTILRV